MSPNGGRSGLVQGHASAPSRAAALLRGRAFMFTTLSKSGVWQLLQLLVPPASVASKSVGVSLYLSLLAAMFFLLIAIAIVGSFPLGSNLSAQNFANSFELMRLDAHSTDTGVQYSPLAQPHTEGQLVPLGNCPRSSKVQMQLWNNMTVGHFCPNSNYSSPFDCPARCIYDPQKMEHPMCQEFKNSSWYTSYQTKPCDVRMPCYTWEFGDTDETGTPVQMDLWHTRQKAAWCFCCDLSLKTDKLKSIPASQFWVWAVLMVAVYLIWLLLVQTVLKKRVQEFEAQLCTSSKFAVQLSGRGAWEATDMEIAKFASHYGAVVSVARGLTYGKALGIGWKIMTLQHKLVELRAIKSRVKPRSASSCCFPLADFLYQRMLCGLRSVDGTIAATEGKCAELKAALDALEMDALHRASQEVVVVFDHARHASAMLQDHSAARLPFGLGWLHNTTGGMLSPAPRIEVLGRSRNGSSGSKVLQPLLVTTAPEPSDVLWTNMVTTYGRLLLRRCLLWLAFLVLLAASGGVQFMLAQMAEADRRRRIYCSVESGCEDVTLMTLDVGRDALHQMFNSMLRSAIVVAVNAVATIAMIMFSQLALYFTYTNFIASTIFKLTLFYIINSFVIPIAAVALTQEADKTWYTNGGVAEEGFFIQVGNAVLPSVVALLALPDSALRVVFTGVTRTQAAMNALMEPPDFILWVRTAHAMRTVALAVLYAPILPISPAIGAFGIAFAYLVDQILIFRMCRKPPDFGFGAFKVLMLLLRILPLGTLLLMALVYFNESKFSGKTAVHVIAPVAVGCCLWVAAALVPVRRLLGVKGLSKDAARGTDDAKYTDLLGAAMARIGDGLPTESGVSVAPEHVAYILDAYAPPVPSQCGAGWRLKLSERYRVRQPMAPADPDLLPGQLPHTGGSATQPPQPTDGKQSTGPPQPWVRMLPQHQIDPATADDDMGLGSEDLDAEMAHGWGAAPYGQQSQ